MTSIVAYILAGIFEKIAPASNAVTEGPSPKVTIPTVLLVFAALVLLVVFALTGDQTILGYALAILTASGVVGVAGSAAGPGSVVVGAPVIGTPSDQVLDDQAAAAITAIDPGDTPVERRA